MYNSISNSIYSLVAVLAMHTHQNGVMQTVATAPDMAQVQYHAEKANLASMQTAEYTKVNPILNNSSNKDIGKSGQKLS